MPHDSYKSYLNLLMSTLSVLFRINYKLCAFKLSPPHPQYSFSITNVKADYANLIANYYGFLNSIQESWIKTIF